MEVLGPQGVAKGRDQNEIWGKWGYPVGKAGRARRHLRTKDKKEARLWGDTGPRQTT